MNTRLGIALPSLDKPLDRYPLGTQHQILLHWEKIRGTIPERITQVEQEINLQQALLNQESDIEKSSVINYQIAELASIINDLQIWYRFHSSSTRGKMDLR